MFKRNFRCWSDHSLSGLNYWNCKFPFKKNCESIKYRSHLSPISSDSNVFSNNPFVWGWINKFPARPFFGNWLSQDASDPIITWWLLLNPLFYCLIFNKKMDASGHHLPTKWWKCISGQNLTRCIGFDEKKIFFKVFDLAGGATQYPIPQKSRNNRREWPSRQILNSKNWPYSRLS